MDEEMKESNDGLSRRKLLVKGAIVVGAAAAAMYVPPKLRPLALPSAHAKASPANKESCEKDANEDCTKCVRDKDPNEKDSEGGEPGGDPNYDKCVADKPCDKDPVADKDPNEKTKEVESGVPQAEPKRMARATNDEWG
jgi:hypothetical protein